MKNINFTKTLIAGVALALALYPQAKAEIITDTDCGSNCRWTYDTTTGELVFKGTGMLANPGSNATNQGAAVGRNLGYKKTLEDAGYTIKSLKIENGFSSIGDFFFTWAPLSTNKITIPESVRSFGFGATYSSAIREVICDSDNINLTTLSLAGVNTLVINGSNNVRIAGSAVTDGTNSISINILCRGNIDLCNNSAQNIKSYNSNNVVKMDYYKAYDKDNRIIEEWDENGRHDYSYKFDGAGNLTASYKDGIATYRKASYTPAEAAAAVKKGNDNKVTLTFK